jgi:hypothetical protein
MKAVKAAVDRAHRPHDAGLSYLIRSFLIFQWLGLMGTLACRQIIAHLGHHVPS